uniref:Cullin-5 n=1 Tax=Aceria tosichella TaxID=561515 RepID=A0A6G1SF46_9ACAR
MLKINGQPDPSIIHSYDQHKPDILRVLRKLVIKDQVTNDEWQDLFHHVHMVCSWDSTGCQRLIRCIEREFYDGYISPLKHRLKSVDDGYQQLKEYVENWTDFTKHCIRLPMAFQQLDLATRDALLKGKFKSSSSFQLVQDNGKSAMKFKFYNNNLSQTPQQQKHERPLIPIDFKNKNQYSLVRCILVRQWADRILNPNIDRLSNSIKELIIKERCGFIIDATLITGFRQSLAYLEELRIIDYHQNHMAQFERMYVESIEVFYSSISDEYLKEYGVVRYITWALSKFEREEQKALQYLEANSASLKKVAEACNRALIKNFVEQILCASRNFIQTNQSDSLKLIFKFFSKIDGLVEKLLEELRRHFVSSGLACLTNLDSTQLGKPDLFVEKLLEVYCEFDGIVKVVFEDDIRACLMLEKALSLIINDPHVFMSYNNNSNSNIQDNENGSSTDVVAKSDPEARCAESLAHYCNILFRKSPLSRKLSNEDFTTRLDQLYMIIKLLKNKEAFIRFHKQHLVKRLIPDATINLDKEEEFVNRLKDVSGMPLDEINELLRMFKDLKTSELLATKFAKIFKPANAMESVNNNNTISNISSQISDRLSIQDGSGQLQSINVRVLNPSAWSKKFDKSLIALPDEIIMFMPIYESFYKDQYEGRELEWCHHLSNGVLSFKNSNGNKYDLEVTAPQLSILYAFNDQPYSLKTFNELRLLSNLSTNELRRTIWSLVSNPKLRVQLINCNPPMETQKDLNRGTNLYSINHNFVLM